MKQDTFYGKSWLDIPENSDFPLYNIPFGMAYLPDGRLRAVSRICNHVVDLAMLYQSGFFKNTGITGDDCFRQTNLNDFISLGKAITGKIRSRLAEIFSSDDSSLQNNQELIKQVLYRAEDVKMVMPVLPGDYTDFYSSIEHATNVGKMFRDPANALLPNWRHLPVGYHGRASSIVISGTPLHRPMGQVKLNDAEDPVFIPTRELDFELEMAFITCKPTKLGESIAVQDAEDYIFGMLLFNDMSARDIQRWEYVPLGPFLSKSFGSVVSPWIVTLEALEPFRTQGPEQVPAVLPYLRSEGAKNFDIALEAAIIPEGSTENVVCKTNFKYMYWNMSQQLAHQTVNGCNIKVGDMYASGTISGPDPGSYGSLLEITWKGSHPIKMPDGNTRVFLEDGDTMLVRGYAKKDNLRIGFGDCTTKVLPAIEKKYSNL
jgi:fumarylacetoacetase